MPGIFNKDIFNEAIFNTAPSEVIAAIKGAIHKKFRKKEFIEEVELFNPIYNEYGLDIYSPLETQSELALTNGLYLMKELKLENPLEKEHELKIKNSLVKEEIIGLDNMIDIQEIPISNQLDYKTPRRRRLKQFLSYFELK